jgi:hypothetical protein
MFFEAKAKGISEDSYADWQAIVAKECESEGGRNFSFKASKRIFRIELAYGDFAKASATFQRLVSFIPGAEPNAVRKGFLNRKQAKNLLHIVCPKLNLVHLPPLTTIPLLCIKRLYCAGALFAPARRNRENRCGNPVHPFNSSSPSQGR